MRSVQPNYYVRTAIVDGGIRLRNKGSGRRGAYTPEFTGTTKHSE